MTFLLFITSDSGTCPAPFPRWFGRYIHSEFSIACWYLLASKCVVCQNILNVSYREGGARERERQMYGQVSIDFWYSGRTMRICHSFGPKCFGFFLMNGTLCYIHPSLAFSYSHWFMWYTFLLLFLSFFLAILLKFKFNFGVQINRFQFNDFLNSYSPIIKLDITSTSTTYQYLKRIF